MILMSSYMISNVGCYMLLNMRINMIANVGIYTTATVRISMSANVRNFTKPNVKIYMNLNVRPKLWMCCFPRYHDFGSGVRVTSNSFKYIRKSTLNLLKYAIWIKGHYFLYRFLHLMFKNLNFYVAFCLFVTGQRPIKSGQTLIVKKTGHSDTSVVVGISDRTFEFPAKR